MMSLWTTVNISTTSADDWLEYFLESLDDGVTIEAAIDYANRILNYNTIWYYDEDGNKIEDSVYGLPIYCVGDQIQYLKIR